MLKKILVASLIFIGVVFSAAQLIRPDFSNPAVATGMSLDENRAFTPEVRKIIKNSCVDCHTNETRYPWYSKITPVNWWLKDHIDNGRVHLNFSTDSPDAEWEEICKEVTRDKMPLPSYTWGHPNAALSNADKKTLCDWVERLGAATESKGSGNGETRGREIEGRGEKIDRR